MRSRTWPWLRLRIVGLLSRPGSAVVLGYDSNHHPVIEPIYPNRIQAALKISA